MNLDRYLETLRRELLTSAAAGGDEAVALAERLLAPLDSASRLVLLDALSTAAGEITGELAPGSVDVRLRGLDPEFVVTAPPWGEPDRTPAAADPAPAPPLSPPPVATDDGASSRINLRLPEGLKVRVEEAAGRDGLSVNAWLVRALSAALTPSAPPTATPSRHPSSRSSGGNLSGWVR
jgi:hypothetical protein